MSATHQFFLTKRSVYLLVLDARNDTDVSSQIRKWVKKIITIGKNAPIIVLANKCDINNGFGFVNERELREEFPQIKYLLAISCKDNTNIDNLRNKLEEIIPTAELFLSEIDEKWIPIKKTLQIKAKENNYLNESDFKKICEANNLKNREEQKQAIMFFHDLGLVLHFEEIAKNLAEYYVLDPYWISYGVYQILTSQRACENKGKINIDRDLEYIINTEEDKEKAYKSKAFKKIEYSTNQRLFLVDILNQFKLCFYQADKKEFIIPDLLDTKEPTEESDCFRDKKNKVIRFVYQYNFLPKIIVPQIIVKFHTMISEMWRTGCILKYENSKALISTYKNQISITVLGDDRMKRDLLIYIRKVIDEINNKSNYKVEKLIPLPNLENEYVKYEILFNREKNGKEYYYFDEDLKTEKIYSIKDLLGDIPLEQEVKNSNYLLLKIYENTKDNKENFNKIISMLEKKFDNLLKEVKNSNLKKDEIISAIEEITKEEQEKALEEMLKVLKDHHSKIDEKYINIFDSIKNPETSLDMKLKLSIPLINLIGIDIGIEGVFDIKAWAKERYKNLGFIVFKLFY